MISTIELEKELSSIHRVKLRDCDAFGHLHNSSYIDYFLEAREEQLAEHYGLQLYDYAQQSGKSWFISRNDIAYLQPVAFNELVRIETRLLAFSNKHVQIEGRLYQEQDTALKAILWCTLRPIDLSTGGPIDHDEQMMLLFSKVAFPAGVETLEERIKGLRSPR